MWLADSAQLKLITSRGEEEEEGRGGQKREREREKSVCWLTVSLASTALLFIFVPS